MPADPPASPLITPDLRRRLQQRYEEAVRLMQHQPADHARVHELLAECLRADPGNILYLDATLANLRQWQPRDVALASWLGRWFGTGRGSSDGGASTEYSVLRTQYLADQPLDETAARSVLGQAPDLLTKSAFDPNTFVLLAAAAAACDLDEAELRFLYAARDITPDDKSTLRLLARALTRQGRFDQAVGKWHFVLALGSDNEAQQAVDDLRGAEECDQPAKVELPYKPPSDPRWCLEWAKSLRGLGSFAFAESYLLAAEVARGNELLIRVEREEIVLGRSARRLTLARRRAESDTHAKAQLLVTQLELEHVRIEAEILHLRCERLPGDMSLRLELARKLKQAGNFSGAISRLDEARGEAALAAEVLLELGECWQHLRQFEKALNYYRQAIDNAEKQAEPRPLALALYRVGVLAAAMGKTGESREALTRLVAIDPGYKDARQRLDNLPPN